MSDGDDGARRLPSGPLSRVYALDLPGGTDAVVVKLAPPAVTAHEGRALREVVGLGVAPRVLAEAHGLLVLQRLPGELVAPSDLGSERATTLGALIRRVHDSQVARTGGWPDWPDRAGDLQAYHAAVVEVVRELAPLAHQQLTARVLDRLPPLPPSAEPGFRRLHGDLWSGNVLWDGPRPALVDWEYERRGGPAEELAYVLEMDALGPDLAEALLTGYGRDDMAPRVDAWRPLVALSAGLWYADIGLEERAAMLLAQAEARVDL